ncbi:hypothetical protein ACFFX0_03740 [Citricoccus parietis]|uniref:Uncharacterized protein n=1 Tax=Citricoccus parietis TaxID=592307 RepID=A0ABV5FUI5_9MICC
MMPRTTAATPMMIPTTGIRDSRMAMMPTTRAAMPTPLVRFVGGMVCAGGMGAVGCS